MLFKHRCPVDADEWEWLLAGFKWLAREFPEREASRRLVLPTSDFSRRVRCVKAVKVLAVTCSIPAATLIAVDGEAW